MSILIEDVCSAPIFSYGLFGLTKAHSTFHRDGTVTDFQNTIRS